MATKGTRSARPKAAAGRAKKLRELRVEDVVERAFAQKTGRGTVPELLLERRRARARARVTEALEARGAASIDKDLAEAVEGLVRGWAERDFEDGFAEAERFELRCFEEGERLAAEASGDREKVFAAAEKAYRAAVLQQYDRIEIRGLQMSERVSQRLDVVYVPLYVEDPSQQGEVVRIGEGIEVRANPRIEVTKLLGLHERVVIVGAPGSGKTTIVAYVAACAAAGTLYDHPGGEASRVPFVVPVRSLEAPWIDDHTVAAAAGCAPDFLRSVLARGRGLVLIDGLDEAGGGIESLLPSLRAFAEAHRSNRFVLTTRPSGDAHDRRIHVDGFATTTLLPMTRDEVHVFIRQWCLAAEMSIQRDAERAAEDARRAAEDLVSRVQTSRAIERLAQTPLMSSVLCVVHRFLGQRIPERRVALYEACTNVLLYEWDRAKFPAGSTTGGLDAQQKRFLLSGLAAWMHEQRVAEASAANVIERFSERLPKLGRPSGDASQIVREIQERSGMLVERRPGFFAFSHLTFQEYLTALELVRSKGAEEIGARSADPWWHEVIALAAGMPGSNAARIIEVLLESDRAKKGYETLLAAHCVEAAVDLPSELRREVERRIEALIPPVNDKGVRSLVEYGEMAAPLLLRALQIARPIEAACCAVALSEMGYEPACGALGRLLSSQRWIAGEVMVHIGKANVIMGYGTRLAKVAAMALLAMARSSALARATLAEAMPREPHVFTDLFNLQTWDDPEGQIGTEVLGIVAALLSGATTGSPGRRDPKPAAHSG